MSRKRKTKRRNRQKMAVTTAPEKRELVVREVEMGGKPENEEREAREERLETREEELEAEEEALGTEEAREAEEKQGASEAEEKREARETEKERQAEETRGTLAGEKAARTGKGGWIHRVNVYYPWLKFVVFLVLAVGMVGGGFGVGQVIGNAIWEAEEKGNAGIEADPPEETGQETEIKEKPAGEGEGEKPEEPQPEEKPSEVEPPAATQPPVTVPETNGRKLVALTFDDGPSAATTGRLLDILKSKGAKATFFVVGSMAQKAPDLVRREVAEGHEVGGHSSYHQDLSKLGAAALQAETAEMDRIFTGILGRKMAMLRPPYGAVSDVMRGYIGKPMIYWSVDPLDWKYRDAATVRANVTGATFDGAVVLMHDIHASTVDAVAGIIDDLRARGYEFLTVSELAAARGVGLANGVVYYHFKP